MTPDTARMTIASIKPNRPADFIIGGADDPYMMRWYLLPKNDVFNVYYHRIIRDDADVLHDHPWPSFSIMQMGQMREITPDGERIIRAGDCVYRPPEAAHRLALIDEQPAETLFIVGPKVREWGFHCPKGWRHWQDFVSPNDTGAHGIGCGEMS